MTLLEQVTGRLTYAMKCKDAVSVTAFRAIKAELDKVIKDKGADSTDEQLKALEKMEKRHLESIEHFDKAGRKDLSEKELMQLMLLVAYLPKRATDQEIADAVATSAKEVGLTGLGATIKAAQAKLAGKRFDNAVLVLKIKESLANLPQY